MELCKENLHILVRMSLPTLVWYQSTTCCHVVIYARRGQTQLQKHYHKMDLDVMHDTPILHLDKLQNVVLVQGTGG